MSLYSALKTNALILCEAQGDGLASAVCEIALVECLKWLSTKITIPELLGSATYTWQSADTSASIVTDFGVSASSYAGPARLYVNDVPYDFREYMSWLDLTNMPTSERLYITEVDTWDGRPARCYTVNLSSEIELYPVKAGDVLRLLYHKPPAAYSDAGSPEINQFFENVLVSGAVLWIKEHLRDPEQVINPFILFEQQLAPQVREMDLRFGGKRDRGVMRLSPSYWTP